MARRKKSLYEVLGVAESASAEEIKKARRQKARQSHPDTGGSAEEMAEINHAFDVLINPERRQLYDRTGQDEEKRALEDEVTGILMSAFMDALDKDATNCLSHARKILNATIVLQQGKKEEALADQEKLLRRKSKITVKSGENLFEQIVDRNIQAVRQAVETYDWRIQVCHTALTVLENYESHEDAIPDMAAIIRNAYQPQITWNISPDDIQKIRRAAGGTDACTEEQG